MKRYFLLIVLFVALGSMVFSEEAVIINFNDIAANFAATEIDFSDAAGDTFSEEEKSQMRVSLEISEWLVELNSSAATPLNQGTTFARPATVNRGDFSGETVLGIRVKFPDYSHNSWALIRPPFEIPTYAGQDGSQFDNRGILKNVGALKEVKINAYGLNYPHQLTIVLRDQDYVEREYFLGNLEFDGWRTLSWKNPGYIEDVRYRELRKYPLYPRLAPSLQLIGFRIYRDSTKDGGDFVTYIRDATLVYDRAILEIQGDIDDEDIWGILQERADQRDAAQVVRYGETLLLEFIERQLQAQEETTN